MSVRRFGAVALAGLCGLILVAVARASGPASSNDAIDASSKIPLASTPTLTPNPLIPNGAGVYADANSQASSFNFPLVRTDTDATTSITYDTIIHLTNPQSSQLNLTLTFDKQDGSQTASVQETLNPFATLDFDAANPPAGSNVNLAAFNGSATIVASGTSTGMPFAATAEVFAHKTQDANDNIDTYAGIATSAASYQPVVIVQFGYQSNLYLQNPTASDATVSITYYKRGTPVPTPTVPTLTVVVPAHGSTIVNSNTVLSSIGSYLGPLVITSTQPIATLLEYVAIQSGSGYGITPMITASNSGRLFIPRYDVNVQVGPNLWNGGILLYNPDSTSTTYTLTFYDQNGNQVVQVPNVLVAGNETGNIGVFTPGSNPVQLVNNNFYSVVVTWTGNLAVAGVKAQGNYPGYTIVAASAPPPSQSSGTSAYLVALRKAANWNTSLVSTGFALMNPDSTSQSYQVAYYDSSGNLVRSDAFGIPASGVGYFDQATDSGLTSGQEYSAIITNTSNGSPPIAAVEEYSNLTVPASAAESTFTPTSSPTITLTPTISPTVTITQTSTASPTSSATGTNTATPTITNTSTDTATVTESPTITLTPVLSFTPSDTPTVTPTPTITDTPTETATASNTASATASATATNTMTPTVTGTGTATPTATASATATSTLTATSTATGIAITPGLPTTVSTVVGSNEVQIQLPALPTPIARIVVLPNTGETGITPNNPVYQPILAMIITALDASGNQLTADLGATATVSITFQTAGPTNLRFAQMYTHGAGFFGQTELLPTTVYDDGGGRITVTGQTSHFSPFVVYAPASGSIFPQVYVPLVSAGASFDGW